MQEGAHQNDAAPKNLERSFEEKRRESWSSERVEAKVFVNPGFEGLKIVSARKDGGGEGYEFLEVIGTNVLANEVVRHFSNLTAKECWESAKRVLRVKRA